MHYSTGLQLQCLSDTKQHLDASLLQRRWIKWTVNDQAFVTFA